MKRKFILLFTLVFMLFVLSSCSSSKVRLKDLLDENREMYSKLSEYHSFIKTEIYFYDENSGECNSLNFSINGASLINCFSNNMIVTSCVFFNKYYCEELSNTKSKLDDGYLIYEFESHEQAKQYLDTYKDDLNNYIIKDNFVYYDNVYANIILGNYVVENDFVLSKDHKKVIGQTNTMMYIKNIPGEIIVEDCFTACSTIYSLTISSNIKKIGKTAFYLCQNLSRVTIDEGVTSIGDYAFFNAFNLKTVYLKRGIEYMGYRVFNRGVIYCEDYYKPEGWDDNWITDDAKVIWGTKWDYDSNGNPVIVK